MTYWKFHKFIFYVEKLPLYPQNNLRENVQKFAKFFFSGLITLVSMKKYSLSSQPMLLPYIPPKTTISYTNGLKKNTLHIDLIFLEVLWTQWSIILLLLAYVRPYFKDIITTKFSPPPGGRSHGLIYIFKDQQHFFGAKQPHLVDVWPVLHGRRVVADHLLHARLLCIHHLGPLRLGERPRLPQRLLPCEALLQATQFTCSLSSLFVSCSCKDKNIFY